MEKKVHISEEQFRLFLQNELLERCRKNPRYSLRSFAKFLEVSPSALSAMLNKKRSITEKTQLHLAMKLGQSSAKIQKLIQSRVNRDALFSELCDDDFTIISDWYHYAILELLALKSFFFTPSNIAKSLKITVTQAQIALERLERVGLIKNENDQWVDVSGGRTTNINDKVVSAAGIKQQAQILEKSKEALELIPKNERNHTSMTVAVNKEDFEEAKVMIKKFRRELSAFLNKTPSPNQVYQLQISFFPLSERE